MGVSSPACFDSRNEPIKIAILVERFPVPTETFILNEARALRDSHARVVIIACSLEDGRRTMIDGESGIAVLDARALSSSGAARALTRGILRSPSRSIAALGLALAAAGPSLRRGYRALNAMLLACRISDYVRRGSFSLIHAQFINRPALVAGILSVLTGIPCSVSAHARDVFVPDFRLSPLVRVARLVVVCSTGAHRHLSAQVSPGLRSKITRLHHGVDLERFAYRSRGREEAPRRGNSGVGSTARGLEVLTVARLVEKKGVDTVLGALDILRRRGWDIRLRLVGDGPQRESLLRVAESLDLDLEHRTRATPEAIHGWMCSADLLAMGCTTAGDGDRDGVPNAVLEAMAVGLPVVSSAGGSVADAVEHAVSGLLTPPGDAASLADAMETIVTNEDLRSRLVKSARRRVEADFDLRKNAGELLALLAEASRSPCHPSV